MEESILNTVKTMLGPEGDYDDFDTDIIIHINSAFSVLTQLGVGPPKGFRIRDDASTWSDFIPDDRDDLDLIKDYVYMKVKLIFDPPPNSYTVEALKEQIKEAEWRLNVAVESTPS